MQSGEVLETKSPKAYSNGSKILSDFPTLLTFGLSSAYLL
jgi:hypothetical protein